MDLAGSFTFIVPLLIFTSLKGAGFTILGFQRIVIGQFGSGQNLSDSFLGFRITQIDGDFLRFISIYIGKRNMDHPIFILEAVALTIGTVRLSRTLIFSQVRSIGR